MTAMEKFMTAMENFMTMFPCHFPGLSLHNERELSNNPWLCKGAFSHSNCLLLGDFMDIF